MKKILALVASVICLACLFMRFPRGAGTEIRSTNINLATLCHTVLSTNIDLATLCNSIEALVEESRSKVANAVRQAIHDQPLGSDRLGELLHTVNTVENELKQANIGPRIHAVALKVASIQKGADALLRDPANKESATRLNLQPWLNKLNWEAAQAAILQRNLDQLRTSLEELEQWMRAWEPLAPKQQLSAVLRQRLTKLLAKNWLRDDVKQAAGPPKAAAVVCEPARPLKNKVPVDETASLKTTSKPSSLRISDSPAQDPGLPSVSLAVAQDHPVATSPEIMPPRANPPVSRPVKVFLNSSRPVQKRPGGAKRKGASTGIRILKIPFRFVGLLFRGVARVVLVPTVPTVLPSAITPPPVYVRPACVRVYRYCLRAPAYRVPPHVYYSPPHYDYPHYHIPVARLAAPVPQPLSPFQRPIMPRYCYRARR